MGVLVVCRTENKCFIVFQNVWYCVLVGLCARALSFARTPDRADRVQNAPEEGPGGHSLLLPLRCSRCSYSLCCPPGALVLPHPDPPAVAAHLLLQYLGQERRSQEGDLLVQPGLGQGEMEPGG